MLTSTCCRQMLLSVLGYVDASHTTPCELAMLNRLPLGLGLLMRPLRHFRGQ